MTNSMDGDHAPLAREGTMEPAPEPVKGGAQTKFLRQLQRDAKRDSESPGYTLAHACLAELLGTMFLVVFGVGSVCAAVLTGYNNKGLWDVTVVWGFGIAIAIMATASISGAHLNPAVSLALAIFRPEMFPWKSLAPYWLAQYTGAVLGGAVNYMVWGGTFRHYEAENGIVRGSLNSTVTASAFGMYFPNPGFADKVPPHVATAGFALLVEAWGAAVLMFTILAVTDPRSKIIKNKEMVPFYIAFCIAVLITLYAPITQGGFNPARDLGPRLVSAMAGWGKIAFPGPRKGFWVYTLGPHMGAIFGAFVYDLAINPGLQNN